MAIHWPKTFGGNLFGFVIAVCVVLIVVQSAIALSGPFVWVSLTVIALTSFVLFTWHRRTMAAQDLAVADAPSFGDVLRHWDAHDDLDPLAR
jgi:hypothetical protein